MKAVLQRVSQASVTVDGAVTGRIEQGLVILLCIEQNDIEEDSQYLAKKSAELRIFADEAGKMNKSLIDVRGKVLLVSQFTLAADWKKGRRPSFIKAAEPKEGERLYKYFGKLLESMSVQVEYGVFGADMDLALHNDGPVTLFLDYQTNTNASNAAEEV